MPAHGYDAGVPRRLTADVIDPAGAVLGEGPAWDSDAGCLVWVDILGRRVHLTEPDGGRRRSYELDRHVGAVLPAAAGGWLLARRDGFARLDPDGSVRPLLDVLTDRPDLRFNDAKCDPRGRAFAGTMPYDDSVRLQGHLFRLDPGPTATPVYGPTSLSNGLGWSPDARRMYFIDTPTGNVAVFDYDLDSATPHDPRTFVRVETGLPDGMCVDDDGCLWVALWGGSAVHRYTPDGRLDTVVALPVTQVSCAAFGPGGRLYITTASVDLDDAQRAAQPLAGALFAVEPGVSGPVATPWRSGVGLP
jgi:sugar lactone lactonase YvrE